MSTLTRLCLAAAAVTAAWGVPAVFAQPQTDGPNLLVNPSFESPYAKQCCQTESWFLPNTPIDEVQVAAGWRAWWLEPGDASHPTYCANCPAWHRPEWREAAPFTSRIRSGANAQKYFTFYSTHQGGMYQQVSGVAPGQRLRFSVYMQAWSTNDDSLTSTITDNDMGMKVGIDPTGGADPFSSRIVWGPTFNSFDAWGLYTVEAVAQSSTVTVFTHSLPRWGMKHNDLYVDDASLVVTASSSSSAAAAPSATPLPTSTPATAPTPTSAAAARPTATNPLPTPTVPAPTPTASPPPSPTPALLAYTIQRGETLWSIARKFSITVSAIMSFNTILNPARVFAGQVIRVPGTQAAADAAPAPASVPPTSAPAIPTAAPALQTYTIQSGETLFSIARRFNTSVSAIMTANRIADPARVFAGQVIFVPGASAPATPPPAAEPPSAPLASYTVQRGDTFANIARKFNIPLASLIAVNPGIDHSRIFAGQALNLPASSSPPAARTYVVQAGDTLRQIAERFGTTTDVLQSLNGLADANRIFVGQTLVVP